MGVTLRSRSAPASRASPPSRCGELPTLRHIASSVHRAPSASSATATCTRRSVRSSRWAAAGISSSSTQLLRSRSTTACPASLTRVGSRSRRAARARSTGAGARHSTNTTGAAVPNDRANDSRSSRWRNVASTIAPPFASTAHRLAGPARRGSARSSPVHRSRRRHARYRGCRPAACGSGPSSLAPARMRRPAPGRVKFCRSRERRTR